MELLASDLLPTEGRDRVRDRLSAWMKRELEESLGLLFALRDAPLAGAARGVAFQLVEGLGSLRRDRALREIDALGRAGRRALRELGVIIGRESVYVAALIKPRAVAMRALLWSVWGGRTPPLPPPPPGRVSMALSEAPPRAFLEAVGYRPVGPLAVRIDMVERLSAKAWALSRGGAFAATPELLSLAACTAEELDGVLAALGYRAARKGGGDSPPTYRPRRKPRGKSKSRAEGPANDSPFADLGRMMANR